MATKVHGQKKKLLTSKTNLETGTKEKNQEMLTLERYMQQRHGRCLKLTKIRGWRNSGENQIYG